MNADEIETDFDIFKSKIKKNINLLFLDFMVSFPFKTINTNYKNFQLSLFIYFFSFLLHK